MNFQAASRSASGRALMIHSERVYTPGEPGPAGDAGDAGDAQVDPACDSAFSSTSTTERRAAEMLSTITAFSAPTA